LEATELFKKVRKIEIKTRGLSNQIFSGQYHSVFKGRGMAFSEVREYQYGDDIRNIDWNVTARFNQPYIKIFEEERELTVMLLIDVSGSNEFGTKHHLKEDQITEIAAVLAFSAIHNNDKVGVIFFSNKIEKFIPPKKGTSHVWRLVKEIFTFEPDNLTTDIDAALTYLNRVVKRHAIVFLISDCMDTGFESSLKLTAKKHDLTILRVSDPAEDEPPDLGLMTLRDPETGQVALINTRSKTLKKNWHDYRRNQAASLSDLLKRTGVDLVDLHTNGSVVEPLTRLFDERRRRL
jgi:uncharacterized protein (DUF58 family)